MKNSETRSSNQIRIVKNVLTAALRLWLRSQVSQVSQLFVEIRASDRQILTGCVPWVSIFASGAVYQGLHLTEIKLVAENIRINIGSVLKGQPLRLLETVPVFGEMIEEEKDLNASLCSTLLSTALSDALVKFLPDHYLKSKSISWQKINLDNSKVILSAILEAQSNPPSLNMSVGLELLSNHELQLALIDLESNTVELLEGNNNQHYLNLGCDVDLQELTLIPGRLVCRGRIKVNP